MLQTTLFGEIDNPLEKLNPSGPNYGDLGSDTGPLTFIGNIIQLLVIVAGIYTLINLVLAGIQYISSQGNPEETQKAWQKIYNSLIGLVVIAVSYTLAAIVTRMLFGTSAVIFSPQIFGPGAN